MTTKVHRVVLLVVDHDNLGAATISSMLANADFPEVMHIDTREVEWTDSHPLNIGGKMQNEFVRLFNSPRVMP